MICDSVFSITDSPRNCVTKTFSSDKKKTRKCFRKGTLRRTFSVTVFTRGEDGGHEVVAELVLLPGGAR